MVSALIGLSDELKLSINSQLEDLDNAVHLSRTCRLFGCYHFGGRRFLVLNSVLKVITGLCFGPAAGSSKCIAPVPILPLLSLSRVAGSPFIDLVR